jgi:hypothetical protein
LGISLKILAIAPVPRGWLDWVFLGCWLSVAVSAATVHLPGGLRPQWALAASLNAGFWSGAVIALAGSRLDLLKALPCVLVLFPAASGFSRPLPRTSETDFETIFSSLSFGLRNR